VWKSGVIVKQFFYRAGTAGTNDNKIYFRGSNNSGTSWGAWWHIAAESNFSNT
jgi:hypothetical protein